MADEDLNAPVGGQPTMPADTIATETASVVPSAPTPVVPLPAPPPADAGDTGAEEANGEQAEPTKPEKMDWRERRRIEETNKRRQAEADLAAERAEKERYRQELERLRNGSQQPGTPPHDPNQPSTKTPEQIRAEAREEAKREILEEQQRQSFAEATGRVLQAGLQAYPDFAQKRDELVQNFGETLNARPDFFDAIINLDNGHDVFYALAADPEQAEQVLSLPPIKMALKLSQIASSAAKPAEPKPKPLSRAPAPIAPVAGGTQAPNRLEDDATPMDDWAQTFLKQMAGRGR